MRFRKKIRPRSRQESRDLTISQLRQIQYGGMPTLSGVEIGEESSLAIAALMSAVDLISSTVAGLDLDVYKRTDDGKEAAPDHPLNDLLKYPNEDVNELSFRKTQMLHVLTAGTSYSEIERSKNGDPLALHLIHWRDVKPELGPTGKLVYVLKDTGRVLQAEDMLVISGLSWNGLVGISPVRMSKETLGVGMAATQYQGAVFGNNCAPNGILSTPQDLKPDTVNRLREQLYNVHGGPTNAGKPMLLTGAWNWVQTSFTPEQAEMIASRTFSVHEVSRLYHIPLSMLFVDASSKATEDDLNIFQTFCIRNWVETLESEYDRKLLGKKQAKTYCVEHDCHGLYRANLAARSAYYTSLFGIGVLSINEVRCSENMDPIEGGDDHWLPVNNLARLEDAPTVQAAPAAEPEQPGEQEPETPGETEPDDQVSMVRNVITEVVGRTMRRGWKGKHDADKFREICAEVMPAYAALRRMPLDDVLNIMVSHLDIGTGIFNEVSGIDETVEEIMAWQTLN